MTTYPTDSLQGLLAGDWWVEDSDTGLFRGKLVWTEVLFYSQIPFEVVAERSDDREHASATLEAHAMRLSGRRKRWPDLPVAGLPRLDGADCFLIQRAKVRPCLVLGGLDSLNVPTSLRSGMPKWISTRHCLAAPFYSADQVGRGGFNPEYVEKIRHGMFSQYFVDTLPLPGGSQTSVLRFDQTFPLGVHADAYASTGFRLDDQAMEVLEEWFLWYLQGFVPQEEMLELFFAHIQSIQKDAGTSES